MYFSADSRSSGHAARIRPTRATEWPDSVNVVTGEPLIGDVFGELLRDALAVATGVGPRPLVGGRLPRPVIEIIERDDGLINGAPPRTTWTGRRDWQPYDHRARGPGARRDAGHRRRRRPHRAGAPGARRAGHRAGHLAGALRGEPAPRGPATWCTAPSTTHVADGRRYDTFLLLGNNLGLFEGRERAPAFLAALAALARPGAQIIAQGTDPYGTTRPAAHRLPRAQPAARPARRPAAAAAALPAS